MWVSARRESLQAAAVHHEISGHPSLSKSKNAAPLPVVSMMYFLAFSPPASVLTVSPAFSAMLTKLITGAWGAFLLGALGEQRFESN